MSEPVAISAAQVKELRELTDAPLMDCKKYLQKSQGDVELAIQLMREDGNIKAAKKEGRITAEGIITIAAHAGKAAMVEINCETDFVARGQDFREFGEQVAEVALQTQQDDVAKLMTQAFAGGTLESLREQLIARVGENVNVRRVMLVNTSHAVGSYRHGDRIGVVVEYQGGDADLGKDLAMHIAASRPEVVEPSEVSAELIEREKAIFMTQAQESGKPADIIARMVEGRINKFLDEVSLTGQPFVKDPDTKVGKLLTSKQAKVIRFARFEVGEGIEKKVDNFVEEVLAQARGN